ncbi:MULTISPECIES: type VI secretion system-associated FHA domain protein TagH [unclassified Luteimonas]
MSGAHTLTLTVLGTRLPPGLRSSYEFHQCGGSIGRSDDSDWMLAAPGISRTHAVVRYVHGLYFLEDRSTNGMLRNGAPLSRGEPVTLDDGDRLQMDTFEVAVALARTAEAAAATPAADPLDSDATIAVPARPRAPQPAAPSPEPALAPAPSPHAGGADPWDLLLPPMPASRVVPDGADADPLAGLGVAAELDPLRLFDAPPPPRPPAATGDWNHSPGSADHFRPPQAAAHKPLLPEEWDLTRGDFASAAAPATQPGPAPAMVAPVAPALAAAPAAAPVPPDTEAILGIVVDGVMEVLRARAEIKNTFRLPVTIIQRSENNPLKFAATPDEAMRRLLQPDGAFLSGATAFEDAFDDIRCHQMAMLAGMRAAFESLLAHFNPDRLEREVDSGGRRAFSGKGRYWERYRDDFERTARDPDECFRTLFGDEFARAYEAQLARLKSARRRDPR